MDYRQKQPVWWSSTLGSTKDVEYGTSKLMIHTAATKPKSLSSKMLKDFVFRNAFEAAALAGNSMRPIEMCICHKWNGQFQVPSIYRLTIPTNKPPSSILQS